MASDAIEIHGGNGYIETWPVARLLRDAQVNTIWEGPDNILCLDVRRGIERANAHEPLLARLHDAVSVSDDDDTTALVSRRVEDLDAAITAWTKLDGAVAEARLFPLAQFMADVYAGRCSPNRRPGSGPNAGQTESHSSLGCTHSGIWPTAARFAASTPTAKRRSNVSTSWSRAPSRSSFCARRRKSTRHAEILGDFTSASPRRPSDIAVVTAAVRSETPSLLNARSRWVFTVASLMCGSRPISAFVLPEATWLRTSTSRVDSVTESGWRTKRTKRSATVGASTVLPFAASRTAPANSIRDASFSK